jgi:diguanylate cyclase (GGDEF)-like protein/PAS domain S-box-containing protein
MIFSTPQETAAKLQLAENLGSIVSWEYWPNTNQITFSNPLYDIGLNNTVTFEVTALMSQFAQLAQQQILMNAMQMAMETGVLEKIEIKFNLPDGSERVARLQAELCEAEEGELVFIGIFQDITEWRKAESDLQNKLNFFNTLLDTVSCPLYFVNKEHRIELCNNAFLAYFGYALENIVGKSTHALDPMLQTSLCFVEDDLLIQSLGSSSYRSTVRYHDGSQRDALLNKSVVTDSHGAALGIVGVLEDITEQLTTAASLKRTEAMKDLVLEINNELLSKASLKELYSFILEKTLAFMHHADFGSVLTLDENNNFRIAASKGYSDDEAAALNFPLKESFIWIMTGGNIKNAIIINDIDGLYRSSRENTTMTNGKKQRIRSSISAPIILNGRLFGLLNIDSVNTSTFTEEDKYLMDYLRDQMVNFISRFRLYDSIVYIYDHDPQTDLYNRRYFEQAFATALVKGQRYGEDFLIASFDIDGLKTVNDLYGHLAGDELIHQFTKTLKAKLRNTDILARVGGDEFVAILFYTDFQEMTEKFIALKKHFAENPLRFRQFDFVCSFSFGVAGFPSDGSSYEVLMRIADERMYIQKSGGAVS